LEAALIIGIVSGALRKMNHSELSPVVWMGAIIASGISLVIAFVLFRLGASLEGPAEPVFEGVTLLLAAGVLTWMIFWMHRQSRTIKTGLEAEVRRATGRSGSLALFWLAFLAVLREGIELALFLTAAAFASDGQQTLTGACLGLAAAVILGWLLFTTTVRLNLRRFFLVTGSLLILFAAGMVARGIHEFNEVGWVPALVEHIWDTSAWISETSTIGELLKALFGYQASPSLAAVIAYLAYFAGIGLGLQRSRGTAPAIQNAEP
jgi:high-affinity iron transporter